MLKRLSLPIAVIVLILAMVIVVPGCTTAPAAATTPTPTTSSPQPTATGLQQTATSFQQILKFVPVSFLKDHDLRFGDQTKTKQLKGYQNVNNLNAYMSLSPDQAKQLSTAMAGVSGLQAINNWYQIAPLIGFDYWMVDSTIYDYAVPPTVFSIIQGNFDAGLITGKLTEQGYKKVDYGSDSYYSAGPDLAINMASPIDQQVLSSLNQVAVMDGAIVTAPNTAIVTGVFDALSGQQPSAAVDPACRAISTSLGDVLAGVIITPERIINPGFGNPPPPFAFTIPADWGLLHQYDLAGMGFSDNGQDRFWTISLYYKDLASASADAETLVNRLNSYSFNTELSQGPGQSMQVTPLTDKFEVGQATVQQYDGGATLTVQCRFKPGTGSNYWQIPILELRDLLFLAPDPAPYVAGSTATPPVSNSSSTQPPPPANNINISVTPGNIKLSISAQLWTPDSFEVRGSATLPDGTYLQTQLYEHGKPASWWPADKIIQVQGGEWMIIVPRSHNAYIPQVSSDNILKVWVKDNSAINAQTAYGLNYPQNATTKTPNSSSTP